MASSIAFDIFARDHASATFNKLGANVAQSEKKFGSFAKKAAIAGAVVGAALVKFGASSVKAFEEAAKSQRQLTDAYARFPKLADVTIKSFRAQADAIQSKTGFDNDQIASTQALLGSYKLTGSQVQQLTPLIVDYAARTGKSLPAATKIAGKAILGQGRALKDIGIAFKDTKSPIGNFNELMTGLREKVGGFAEKEGKSATGRAEILKRKFEDFQESVGEKLIPALLALTDVGITVMDWMSKHKTIVTVLAAVIGGVLVVAITAATVAWIALNLAFIATPIGALLAGMVLVVVGVTILYKKFQIARTIINAAWTGIRVWIQFNVAIIKGLFISLIAVGRTIGNGVSAAWHGVIQPVFNGIKSGINAVRSVIVAAIHGIQGAWRGIGSGLAGAAAVVRAILNGIASSIHAVQSALDALANRGTATAVGTQLGFGGGGSGGSRPVANAEGGPIRAGQLSWVGERGPELFVPNQSGTIIPNNQLTGGGLSAGAIAAAVADALSGAQFRFDGDGLATLVTKRQQAYAVRGGRR